MSPKEVRSTLFEVLQEVQVLRGRSWTDLSPTDKPIDELDGFDSLTAIEATVMVEERLGCGELGVDSVFVTVEGTRALTVGESVQCILNHLTAKEANA